MNQIDEYLKQVIVRNGSDLHFIAGEPPRARIYGELAAKNPGYLAQFDSTDAAGERVS